MGALRILLQLYPTKNINPDLASERGRSFLTLLDYGAKYSVSTCAFDSNAIAAHASPPFPPGASRVV